MFVGMSNRRWWLATCRSARSSVPTGMRTRSTVNSWRLSSPLAAATPESETSWAGVAGAASALTAVVAACGTYHSHELRRTTTGCEGVAKCERAELPIFSRAEVAKHTSKDQGVWVTYEHGVYDITKFLENHPGGTDKIMLAAGKAIDPFWRIYQQHTNRGNAKKILSDMQIGVLDPKEPPTVIDSADPYASDPERHPGLTFHNTKPCNAELPPELMMDNWVTPNELWFIRHHHPVPTVDKQEDYRLQIGGLGCKPILLDIKDLKHRFHPKEVCVTIQCGGNRRGDLNKVAPTSGISWGIGAMSTGNFKGALLRDVLMFAGLVTPESAERDGVKHVIFEAMDGLQASIPIEKALSPFGDVILAYNMNGEDLPPEHGFPLRMVVPGHVGVRNVKWVHKIYTSNEEAKGPWQRGMAYKGFSPSLRTLSEFGGEEAIEKVASIQEQPVTSAILFPKQNEVCELDDLTVKGIAWSGGGRGIVRVDVSIDGGKFWHTAELQQGKEQHPSRSWAWTFWEADIPIPDKLRGKKLEVICKATDISYNVQPEHPEGIWNLRGLNNNSWFRVHVNHKDD